MFSEDAYPRDLQFLFAMTSSLMAPGAAARMTNSGDAAALGNHELLQRLDRPYSCPVPGCGGRFHRKFTLHEHMKTHTGEKPHACPLASCGKRFSASGNLARHKRLHTLSKLKCPVTACTRVFTKKEKLIRHLKVHMGSTTHTCTVADCFKTFSTAGNLTRHMKTQHPTHPTHSGVKTAAAAAKAKARSELLPDRIICSASAVTTKDEDMEHSLSASTSSSSRSQSPQASPLRQSTPSVSPAPSPIPADKLLDYEILELLDCLFAPEAGAAPIAGAISDCHGVVVEPLSAMPAPLLGDGNDLHLTPVSSPPRITSADEMMMYL